MQVLGFFKKIFALIITAVMFIGVGSNGAPAHTVLNEETCRLCISTISDVHVEGNNIPRYNVYGRILKDTKNNSFGSDVTLFLGDNTMNGQEIESLLFYGALAKTNLPGELVVVPGNHDVGNGEGDFDKLKSRFLTFNNYVIGNKIENSYYYKVVDGYYFIVLSPDDLCVYDLPISIEQQQWFEDTLALASQSGKPIFVCAHHPIYDVELASGDDIYDILQQYRNLFWVSGHTHFGPANGWTFDIYNGVNEVNLPRCTELGGESDKEIGDWTGYAAQLEVYDGEVIGRVRNYYTGEWEPSMDYHFPLS